MAISSIDLPVEPKVALPRWLGEVCHQREHFLRTVFLVHGDVVGHNVEYFAFGFAYQNPRELALYGLDRVRSPIGSLTVGDGEKLAQAAPWGFEFKIGYRYWFSSDGMQGFTEGKMEILTDVLYLPNGRCVSHAIPVSLRDFLDGLPPVPVPKDKGDGEKPPVNPSYAAKLIAEHPWAMGYIDAGVRLMRKHTRKTDDNG